MWVTCGFQLMSFDCRSRGFSWRSLCHALLVLHWFGACCWEPVHHGIEWGWPSVFDPLFILMVVILFFYPWSINAATGLGASISLEAASIMVASLGSCSDSKKENFDWCPLSGLAFFCASLVVAALILWYDSANNLYKPLHLIHACLI